MCLLVTVYNLWLFNIAMENCPFTDDFPSELNLHLYQFLMDFPVRYVK